MHTPNRQSWPAPDNHRLQALRGPVIQRKVLTPNDFASLQVVVDRLDAFEHHYNQIAKPFEWNFTRRALADVIARVADHEPRLRLAA
jgi:hypothetical protein